MKIFAHRGASGRLPEMTLASYLGAIEDGADGFECDVRLTSDREIVCFHDANTERISGTKKRISKIKLHELQELVQVISLDELLTLAIKNGKNLLIESKHPVLFGGAIERKVIGLLKEREVEISESGIEIICMSFSWFAAKRFAKACKAATVSKYYFQAILARTQIVALNIDLIKRHPKLVSKLQRKGKRIFSWTVNEGKDMKFCKEVKIEGIITNYPDRARKYV